MIRTEQRNESSINIDKMSALDMTAVMQQANLEAANAVGNVQSDIAKVIDAVSDKVNGGGRIFYVGCGTSGRLGVLDASECPPTYGVPHEMVVGIIAGGDSALRRAAEAQEDINSAGKTDIEKYNITANDSVIGISVAGNAAYVVGALEFANSVGALTVAITCNNDCLLTKTAKLSIVTDTGPEIITGSTRMKAGTAHKMVLNMVSTGTMIKIGRVYSNYMIHIKPANVKLKKRMISITMDILNCSNEEAVRLLEESDWSIPNVIEKASS